MRRNVDTVLTAVDVEHNSARSDGGGVLIGLGTASLAATGCKITNNTALRGTASQLGVLSSGPVRLDQTRIKGGFRRGDDPTTVSHEVRHVAVA